MKHNQFLVEKISSKENVMTKNVIVNKINKGRSDLIISFNDEKNRYRTNT